VESGRVKTYKLTSEGKEVIFNIVNPGEILGLAEVLLNCPRMRYAETLCDTTLWVMSKKQLFDLFYSNNDLCFKNMWILTQQLLRYQNIVEDLAVLPVRDRVIKLLVRLCKELGIQKENYTIIDFPITHEEIAQMVGSTRQTVTLILNELRKKGILTWKQKKIKILRWMDLIDQT
jgi:CRP/FNR family transcriptional regulator